jgi:hypothetical protein
VDTENKKHRLKFMFQEIDLAPGDFVIGRSPSCNLTLEDPLVSRRHVKIHIDEDHARLDDLGSRNGTLINGEPVFENHRLSHQDRIRIGSHEMLFIEEKRFPSTPLRRTGALITCPGCRVPFPSGASNCPHCGAPIIPDAICPSCKQPAQNPDDELCLNCGAALDRDDSTIPVELGGGSSGWTSQLVNEVIEKAIGSEHFQQAASLLQGKIEDYERKSKRGVVDVGRLVDISGYNLALAKELGDPERAHWVLRQWTAAAAPMPEATLDALLDLGPDKFDIRNDLVVYLEALEANKAYAKTDEPMLDKLRSSVSGERPS